MRLVSSCLLTALFICSIQKVSAQNCLSTGVNGTVVNLPCGVNCAPMSFKVPHLKSTEDYNVVSIPYNPFPYTTSAPGLVYPGCTNQDDKFFDTTFLPFAFCFYGNTYSRMVVSTNGLISFDSTLAKLGSNWSLTASSQIPSAGSGALGSLPCPSPTGTLLPRAAIFGAYYDIDIDNSSANKKMEYRIEGSAPCRRAIISFNEIPLFSCTSVFCTQQIVIYESTGIVEVYIHNKPSCAGWNGNLGIVGIQNWARDKAAWAPGKNCTIFTVVDSAWRFVPSGPVSRFVKAELCNISGTPIATTGVTPGADTITTVAGLLDINFPQQCQTNSSTQYIVKTYYASCSDPSSLIISSDTITVNKTTSLNATTVPTPSACGPNGSISVTIPSGAGTLPYTLILDAGSPVTTSNQQYTFTGLNSGTHSIVITTADGCSQTLSVFVPSSGVLTVVSQTTPPTCSGAANGSITINPQNGVAPFQYNINGGAFQLSNTFSNLGSGSYLFGVKDASGCVLTNYQVSLAPGAPLQASYNANPTSCNGATNGSITMTPGSGTSPFTYSINGGAYQTGNTFSNLAPGTYFITMKDAIGCTSGNLTATVLAGSGLTATPTSLAPSCNGANNGSINITPTSGSGPYQYSLNGGPFLPGSVITGLASGTYTVVLKDGANCVSPGMSVVVSPGGALLATATQVAASCSSVSNGKVIVTPSNGSGPYSYSLDGVSQTDSTFLNVPSGVHSVILTDGAGCVSAPISVTVLVGLPVTGTAAGTSTSCNGASNGQVTVTPGTTGVTPFKYSIDGGIFQSSPTFTGLATGTHTVIIQDAVGCSSAPVSVSVTAGPSIDASFTSTPTSCGGASNGTVTMTPTVGTGPFTFTLNGGTPQSSPTFTGLAAGSYNVVMLNAAGCTSSAIAVQVNPGQPLTASATTVNVLCNGGSTGSLTVQISNNATPPYQYSIDGTTYNASNVFNNLPAGTYTVYFRDNNSCNGTQSFTITEPTAITASAVTRNVSCNGLSNGLIRVTATGGVGPYTYSRNGGANYQAIDSFNVGAGTYPVYVKDNNGCVFQIAPSINITEPAVLTASAISSNATCDGGSDGTITVSASGGTTGYQYALNGGSYQSSNIFNVTPGNYNVSVKDANGCVFAVPATTVGLTNNLTLTQMADPATICEGSSVTLQPTTNATQFAWTPAAGLNNGSTSSPVASPTVPTTYYLVATKGNCVAYDTVLVNVNPAPVPDAGGNATICFGQDYQLQGSGGTSYEWSPGTFLNSTSVYNPTVTDPDKSTQYSLHVVDANGCHSLQPSVMTLSVTPPIKVTVTRDTIVALNDQFQLHASSIATNYVWTPATNLSDANIANPIVTVTGDITYVVTATTNAGCIGTASVSLKVYEGPEIYVASAFSPNGDGRNEIFRSFSVGISEFHFFRIYNRWGQMIYSTTTMNAGWDGRINGVAQPTGTYVWTVEGVGKNGRVINKRGVVTLIR
jgi:gliding motility-associated-like protein